MPKSEVIHIRVSPELKKKLRALAKKQRRSKSFVAADILSRYLNDELRDVGEVS